MFTVAGTIGPFVIIIMMLVLVHVFSRDGDFKFFVNHNLHWHLALVVTSHV